MEILSLIVISAVDGLGHSHARQSITDVPLILHWTKASVLLSAGDFVRNKLFAEPAQMVSLWKNIWYSFCQDCF